MAESSDRRTSRMLRELSEVLSQKADAFREMSGSTSPGHTLSTRSEEDILGRANKMQKAMKRRVKPYPVGKDSNDTVLIAVCEMRATVAGAYSRAKCPYIEIDARKSDTYPAFAARAAQKCGLREEPESELALFKLNGARILDEVIFIKGKSKPWTLGNYLLLMKKSPSSVKIGVCAIPKFSSSDSDDARIDSEELPREESGGDGNTEIVLVEYMLKGRKRMAVPVTRQSLLAKSSHAAPKPYHPEMDNYEVMSVIAGGEVLLAPVHDVEKQHFAGFAVTKASADLPNDFSIAWQSRKVITVKSMEEPVTLYCIASLHEQSEYKWRQIGGVPTSFPQSPVIYVEHEGLYQCAVTCDSVTMKSKIISVRVSWELDGDSSESSPGVTTEGEVRSKPDVRRKDDVRSKPSLRWKDDVRSKRGLRSKPQVMTEPEQMGALAVMGGTGVMGGAEMTGVAGENETASGLLGAHVEQFHKDDIEKATTNYSSERILGRGGFGVVYKGLLHGTYVAMKILTEDGAMALVGANDKLPQICKSQRQLRNEMHALTRCRHRNLVDLMGFCVEPPVLVYEFMEQGNLHNKLHGKDCSPLDWNQRSKILKDVCRGLTWLHGLHPPMIHGDMKSSNILLDSHLMAKIGDFGFTQEGKIVEGRTMVTALSLAKSLGYCAPEKDTGRHSPKSDMYSYGVIVLETFSGQLPYTLRRDDALLTEHLEDQRKTVQGYSTIADARAGELAPYLCNLYMKVTEHCLQKHSKRPNSEQVMMWWCETNF